MNKYLICYLITKPITNTEEINKCLEDISKYIYDTDKFILLYTTKEAPQEFLKFLSRYQHVEYAKVNNVGEAGLYKVAMNLAIKEKFDFLTVLEPYYYYEDNGYQALKKAISSWEDGFYPAVLTPVSLLTCDEHKQKAEEKKEILGCRLTGTLINVLFYQKTPGFNVDYFQTTFDYEYCIEARKLKFQIYVMNKIVLRNRKYTMLRKRKLFIFDSFLYERSGYELYYETRNRHYLWDKYRLIDPKYVALDKKLYRKELKLMRELDPNYGDKLIVINDAIKDYHEGVIGPKFNENQE